MAKSMGDGLAGRFSFPLALLAFPLYLVRVSGLRVFGDFIFLGSGVRSCFASVRFTGPF